MDVMYCKKLKCFSYNIWNTANPAITNTTMTVNPNLAALMRVIEDNQDKMPEGEYLEAMNALGALHREIPAAAAPPPSYAASVPLFAAERRAVAVPGMENPVEQAAWYRVTNEHPEHIGITAGDWMELSCEYRNRIVREATEVVVDRLELNCRNPEPEECPFIARHAVGTWRMAAGVWECVCGYKGFCRNWQKHEQSERHQDWAKHRTVSRRKIESMKRDIQRDEEGQLCRFKPLSQRDLGGIRCFITRQERNEWTHPELYTEFHRSPMPMPTSNGVAKWFVHPRNLPARVFVQW